MQSLTQADLAGSAVVFSPHQDDETLGCGGTIIKKRRAGAAVKIVFMTDGRQSHGHLIPGDELKIIRAREAVAAAEQLGVAAQDVIFLEFEDGKLGENYDRAVFRVTEVLKQAQPQEVFIPYRQDVRPDHIATQTIVTSALKLIGHTAVIYEYPIWFWYHWPWVSIPFTARRSTLAILHNSLMAGLGLRLYQEFRWWVDIREVLDLKRTALAQHRSQMTRLIAHPGWLTLSDVSNGEFLACFLQEHEIFRRYSL